jgi:hypothetical protein
MAMPKNLAHVEPHHPQPTPERFHLLELFGMSDHRGHDVNPNTWHASIRKSRRFCEFLRT